jgi:signal transduction histidine kinase/CheY-like chemotaxis protein
MTVRVSALIAVLVILLPGHVFAAQERDPVSLARAVEARAASTDFAALEAFGRAAMTGKDRESLNRLYHVTWTILNQGEFEQAATWNRRLSAAASAQGDARYLKIAHLNDLTIRYDTGETAAAAEMALIADQETDWFVKAHATRIYALALMDQDRIGDGLKLLNDAAALVPEKSRFADTARAGLWEMTGIGLMKLNDIRGATAAFSRFEIDYNNPAYPRPDFDAIYNLTRLSIQVGDQATAERLWAIHHRLSHRSGLESLMVYDARLCAMVAEAGRRPADVLACLGPYGETLGAADFLASMILPARAIARAQTGDVAGAQRDLDRIQARIAAGEFREEGVSVVPHVRAEILRAQGRSDQAFDLLRDHARDEATLAAQRFSGGIGQITGDMEAQLTERRRQLETIRANAALQKDVIASQRWIVGIAVVFLLSAAAFVFWQWRLSRDLRVARRRAEDANRAKSEFLANMSHEIRTPLNGVVAMADALSRRTLAAAEQDMVSIIRSSGTTLERLLSDILDSAKIEAGQISVETAPFHLGDAVREIVALWRPRAQEKGIRLEVGFDPALEMIALGDVVRVRQILANLVSNALKFTTEGQVSLVVAPTPDGLVRFTVSDTGEGFDAEQRARIFGRFHQADGSITRRFGGTGLGLAISRDLAKLMGGHLDCHAVPGDGATFWFEIPLPPASAEAVIDRAAPSADLEEPGGLRILLADDHPANRKVIEVLLASADVTLVAVENGQEAVEAFRAGGIDLVLMDMQMPVMDGLAATAEIRRIEIEAGQGRTPILMLTANAMAEHVEAGRRAGADGHLAKPITTATLFDAIGRVLDPTRAAQAA